MTERGQAYWIVVKALDSKSIDVCLERVLY